MADHFPQQAKQASETDKLLPHDSFSGSAFGTKCLGSKGLSYAQSYKDGRDGVAQCGGSRGDFSQTKRQLGLFSAVFLIFNCIIGTGIYATPSIILRSSGSVGIALLTWIVGALLASTGIAVYIELGTGLPRSGGEKNYLEFMYRRPRFLITCIFAVYILLMRSQAANSIVFGEYVVHSLSITPSRYNTRAVAFLCLTFCLLIHGVTPTVGLRLQNTLGLSKLVILFAIATFGMFCLTRVPGFSVDESYEMPDNFTWSKFWEGSGTTGVNAFATGLFNVLWSFEGYTRVNQVLSEVRDPVRTIQRAAPLAMLLVTTAYISVNVAYFAVVAKADMLGSGTIVAALFFRNLFGATAEKAVSIIIAISMLGNLLAGIFSGGRVIQELGREGVLPHSSFFASNEPYNGPLAGLFTQYLFSCILMLAPPPGDAYLVLVSSSMYSISMINTLVSFGLLLLHTPLYREWKWSPPFRAPKFVIIIFFLSNVFLVTVPFIPPVPGSRTYKHLPYWAHVAVPRRTSLEHVWCRWLASLIARAKRTLRYPYTTPTIICSICVGDHMSISSVMMSRLMLNLHAATDLGLYSTYIPRAAPDEMTDSSSSQPCRTVELDTLWTADLERSHPGPGPGPRISDPDSRILHDLGVPHPPPSPAPPRTAS
ncbi:hypothetical protein D9615_004900 [Tricholomella constricta]|uniref:Uncharacterized protein n=1 Tax=Tricholomella constricta TaxID=117010 RepID=A0A8H5HHD2_9AGAR|nr:hypothetical protein D9615_004900 [Tricholomella constricta]